MIKHQGNPKPATTRNEAQDKKTEDKHIHNEKKTSRAYQRR